MSGKLKHLVTEIRDYWGLRRKQPIGKLVTILRKEGFQCPHVLSGIGEDAAAIDLGGDNIVLLTTDAIVPELASSNPFVAGYASILVNVNDIYAAGGRPIAAMVNVAFSKMEVGAQFMRGICEAGQKFRVEVVRGHTTPDATADAVSASICGVVQRNSYISAGGAQTGDNLVLAVDLEGRISPNYPLGWDTTTQKDTEKLLHRYEVMRRLGQQRLLNASKDLSNGGIIGTSLLLLEYARKGAVIDLAAIPYPQEIELKDWLKMYISTGFVVTTIPRRTEAVLAMFHEHGFAATSIGTINDDQKLRLKFGSEEETVFDFTRESIVAPPKPPQIRSLDSESRR